MDATDFKILHFLQENSKYSYKQLGDKVHLSASGIKHRINKMTKKKIIKGHTIIIDYEELGLSFPCSIAVKLKSNTNNCLEHFKSKVMEIPEINFCGNINAEFDFLIMVFVRDREEYLAFYEETLSKISDIGNIKYHAIVDVVKNDWKIDFSRYLK